MNIHSNARTCPISRATIVGHVQAGAWTRDDAIFLGVSQRTGFKWAKRFREEGHGGLLDRSSRPARVANETPPARAEVVLTLRRSRLTALEIATKLRMPRSTVAAVLKRHGLGRIKDLEPPVPVVRYERESCGDLVHLDVKKLGKIRGGAGHRVTGDRRDRSRGAGWEFVHVAIDDYSRLAYVEVLANEEAKTTEGFLRRALIFYKQHGIRVRRILTDNAKNYVSHALRDLCAARAIKHKLTRPYRPCTNGKAERFIQTLLREWAYKRPYASSRNRTAALPRWLRRYNHHRPHGSLGRLSPIARVVTQR